MDSKQVKIDYERLGNVVKKFVNAGKPNRPKKSNVKTPRG